MCKKVVDNLLYSNLRVPFPSLHELLYNMLPQGWFDIPAYLYPIGYFLYSVVQPTGIPPTALSLC